MNMPKVTIVYADLLIVLGLAGYLTTGRQSVTALIPTFFGIVILIVGLLARNESRRKHAMHVAAVLGLIGFVATVGGFGDLFTMLGGEGIARPAAVISKSIMALLSLVFVLFCLKSFIDARRTKPSQESV